MKTTVKLALMMFLEFLALPIWFVPLLPYVQSLPGGEQWAIWCGMAFGFGTLASPLIGMFADRYMAAERMLSVCYFVTAALLVGAFFARTAGLLFALILPIMFCYMPTWSLTATIALTHASPTAFPRIRVFGTIGWVASGIVSFVGARFFGIADFDMSPWTFAAGAAVLVVAGIMALFLPSTEPKAKGVPMSVVDALGLRAFSMFKDKSFLAFVAVFLLGLIPFQWYNVYCAEYLRESGFHYLTLTMNLGQVGEIVFMLLVPILMRRYGVRRAMALGLIALVFRYVCFTLSSAYGWHAFDFGGILIHGFIFGLLIVGSQMYVDEVAPPALRNQAQGLMTIVSSGLAVFLSNSLFDTVLSRCGENGCRGWTVAYSTSLVLSLVAAVLMWMLSARKGSVAAENAGT